MANKIILYNLTESGTIPLYIADGGYLANPNNNQSPQDFDLVGAATSGQFALEVFDSEQDLLSYASTFMADSWLGPNNETIVLAEIVAEIWGKANDANPQL